MSAWARLSGGTMAGTRLPSCESATRGSRADNGVRPTTLRYTHACREANQNQKRGTHLNEQPTPEAILQVGLGFWPSKILLSAVEMELFTDLAKGPQSLDGLTGRL